MKRLARGRHLPDMKAYAEAVAAPGTRELLTRARLPDGRVLLVGGLRDGGFHDGPNGGMHDAPAVPTVEIFQ